MDNDSPVAVYPMDGGKGADRADSAFGTLPPTNADHLPASEPTPAPEGLKTWLAGGLAAAVFGIGGFFAILAVTHHSHASSAASGLGGAFPGGGFPGGGGVGFPAGRGRFGTISAISGSTLTLSTPDGSTMSVTTSSATKVTKMAAGARSEIKAGDNVVVRGAWGSGGVTATRITDSGAAPPNDTGGPPGGGNPLSGNPVSGTVATVGRAQGSFTVSQTGDAMVIVTTTSSTSVTVVQPSTLSALAVGDAVQVTGSATSGTVAATAIESGATDLGPGFGGPQPPA